MIRESLYFSFANRRSSDFGIYNVSVSQDLYNEFLMSNRNIKEISIPRSDKPLLQYVQREPISFTVTFMFEDTWNDNLMDDVIRWLNVENYQPLQFQSDMNRVYYAMPTTGLDVIHNGLKQGYLNVTFRCDSSYAYSPQIITPWYDTTDMSPYMFQIENKGHEIMFPEIDIIKVGNGDISIKNFSNSGQEFKFVGLVDREELYIHCENEIIDSSLNVYRYDNFNDNYLSFPYGLNTLQITGSCKIRFSYQYVFLK